MKTIGFIDYYINEWHANNYPAWIKEICEKTGQDFCVKYAWSELPASPLDGVTTEEWCETYGCEKCETIEELCQKSDYIIILSPSNPERHLDYVKEAFKCGKNIYVDKTFAPDLATAKEIFATGEQYGTKFFSSSALRYATELDELKGADSMVTLGGGKTLDEYVIHQAEMVIKILDAEPTAIKVEKQDAQYICNAKFEGGKNATMIFAPSFPFAVCIDKKSGESVYKEMASPFFNALLTDVLNFFETGEVSFDLNQTLKVMKLREAAVKGMDQLNEWIEL